MPLIFCNTYRAAIAAAIQKLFGIGSNASGQLGIGYSGQRLAPFQPTTNTDWKMVACGTNHTVAVKTNGTLWSWGENSNGQLGKGNATNVTANIAPVQIGTDTRWLAVGCGGRSSFAIKTDGTLWAWGENFTGMLGKGTDVEDVADYMPAQIGTETNWKSVTGGHAHTGALKTNGTLWMWGSNGFGQLGNSTNVETTANYLPIQVGTSTNWTQLSCGGNCNAAIMNNGTLWTWGHNGVGQLGKGATSAAAPDWAPAQVGTGTNWKSATISYNHLIATTTIGTLWSCGDNTYGQLGKGTTTNIAVNYSLAQVGTATNWNAGGVGFNFTIATRTNGTLWSCGDNTYGQLGKGTNTITLADAAPVQVGISTLWSTVSLGVSNSVFAFRTDSTLWAWGRNLSGALGNHESSNELSVVRMLPVGVDATPRCVAGSGFTSTLLTDGTLWAWGNNTSGQLGKGTNITSESDYIPTQIGLDANWKMISAGINHNVAIKTDGTLWAWGGNAFGQLGRSKNSATLADYAPVQMGTAANWRTVECGTNYNVAIKTDGTLWAWGLNTSGQLGKGTNVVTSADYTPAQIGTATNWLSISAGTNHTIAIKTDGTLWAWGTNANGQLGKGASSTTTADYAPMQIGTAANWLSISAGNLWTMALRSDGTLWTWGYNYYGQLGKGHRSVATANYAPVQLGTSTNWANVSAAFAHAVAIKKDGTLWVWGSGGFGQLGTGVVNFVTANYTPAQVGVATNWKFVARSLSDSTIVVTV